MTIRELRNIIRLKHLPDQWWIAVDNEVHKEKIRLIDLEMRQSRLKNRKVHILNTDITHCDREWTQVDFSGLNLSPKLTSSIEGRMQHPESENNTRKLRNGLKIKQISHVQANDNQSCNGIKFKQTNGAHAEDDQSRKLEQKENELKALERELREREAYVKRSEEILIQRSYLHEVREAEIQQLSENAFE